MSDEGGVRTLTPLSSSPPARERRVPWVAWAATGALAAGAAVAGALALSSSNDLRDERDSSATSRAALDRGERHTARFAAAADVLAIGAVVVGGVSLYLTLKPRPAAVGAASPAPPSWQLGVGPGSLGLRANF